MRVIKRFIAAIAVLVPLGIYVLTLQWTYERVSRQGPSVKSAALFFAALFLGSVTYDFVKRVLLMPEDSFLVFSRHFAAAWAAIIGMMVMLVISAICFNYSTRTTWIGVLTYIAALGFIPFFIGRLTAAIDSAVGKAQ